MSFLRSQQKYFTSNSSEAHYWGVVMACTYLRIRRDKVKKGDWTIFRRWKEITTELMFLDLVESSSDL